MDRPILVVAPGGMLVRVDLAAKYECVKCFTWRPAWSFMVVRRVNTSWRGTCAECRAKFKKSRAA